MATIEEMAQWAIENAPPERKYVGRVLILRHFNCKRGESVRATKHAAKICAGMPPEPIEIVPPVISAVHKFDPTHPAYRGPTIQRLRKGPMSLEELGRWLGTDERDAKLMVDDLKATGYAVEEIGARFKIGKGKLGVETAPTMLDYARLRTPIQTIGVIADLHMCNLSQRLDVQEMAYEEFSRQGVEVVYDVGNMLDGYKQYINGDEVSYRNVDDQCNYSADHHATRPGMTTYFITGDCHEGWWGQAIGLDVGRHMEHLFQDRGRKDLVYAGFMERDFVFPFGAGQAIFRIFHPGGGTAYAQSYRAQKIVESYQGGEKPSVLILGHFHKMGSFYPRGVHVALAGCCEDQTRWMRKKSIEAHVGFGIIHFAQDKKGGISRFCFETFPLYDKGYHLDAGEWAPALYDALGK